MVRLNLRTKVLIPVAIMILGVIIIALTVVNQVVRRQVLAGVSHELEKSKRIFQELQQKEWDLFLERSFVIAEAPHLKAAVDTGDSTTVQRVADEIFNSLSSDILLVIGCENRMLAQNGLTGSEVENIRLAPLFSPETVFEDEIALLQVGPKIYRVFGVPILTKDDIAGVYFLGKVVIGRIIDDKHLQTLKNLVECEIAFLDNEQVIATTLIQASEKRKDHPGLEKALANYNTAAFRVDINNEEYLAERSGLHGNYVLLKSVDQAFKPIMQPIEKTMIFVGGFAFLAAILISSFVSHQIVTPVKKLVDATQKITVGNYEHLIEAKTQDEIGLLAAKFDEMRQALKQKMTQLNERNVELEEALKKLKSAQEELVRSERLAATGKITAQLSHELNNPIHNIQSCLEAAQKKIASKNAGREFIDLAYDEALRIGKLTRQMMDFYRPYVGSKQKVDVNRILENVLKSSETTSENGQIQIKKNLSPEVAEITASPDQLKQVFLNLLFNAVDAMPNGGILTVSSYSENEYLCVTFEDTGCGILPENLDKIFDAFFTTKAQANGVGLGLSVSYGIVRSHGGHILVESEMHKGSKFIVQLPG